jgi:hypothetical protein
MGVGDAKREGSSVDELIMSQIAAALAAESDIVAEAFWRTEVHDAVLQCLDRNWDAVEGIANQLWEHTRMQGQPLRAALARVA